MSSPTRTSPSKNENSVSNIRVDDINSAKIKGDDNLSSSAALMRTIPEAATRQWKLEESSLWWLSYCFGTDNNDGDNNNSSGWHQKPGNVLLLTSVPFFAGAYFGYKVPATRLEDLVEGGTSNGGVDSKNNDTIRSQRARNCFSTEIKIIEQDAVKVVAARTASKALRIATLGTFGTFGFIGAIGFYMSGCDSLEDAVSGTKRWASSLSRSLEGLFVGDKDSSRNHPEVLETKHMDGYEELQYIYDKFIEEEEDGDDTVSRQNEEDPAPTLYMIYQKYFPKN
mmetsp:Transcript_12147/g.13738  ORF Transcript_12147/g.13738 Transcript_12147/m.13738 type:complete len:282 (+) Transcript_12147:263-1108(+)